MSESRYKFSVARYAALQRHPYLASAYMALTLVDAPEDSPTGRAIKEMGTMGVDKRWRLYASPDVWDKWSVKQQAGVLYHEIWHLLRNHHTRMETYAAERPYISNIGTDCEINDDIMAEGVDLPTFPPCKKCGCNGGPCTPKLYKMEDGKMAEAYYHELLSYKLNCPCECHQGGGGDGFPNNARPGAGSCGSAASGKQAPWELPDEGGKGQEGVSEARGDLIRNETAKAIRDHGKQAGHLPDHAKLWAESYLDPKVNWRKELAYLVRRAQSDVAGMLDYSYRRPPRRDFDDILMPSLRKPVPEIAVVADTSGSMGGDMDNLMAEVAGIIKSTTGTGCPVLSTDADVHTMRRVFRANQVELIGGGGTDMTVGIRAASHLRPKPHICVILTDMFTPWGDTNFGMKVIVAHIGEGGDRPAWPHKYIKVED